MRPAYVRRLVLTGVLCLAASGVGAEVDEAGWEPQGDWLVHAAHRGQWRKPSSEAWQFRRDETGRWQAVYRQEASTIRVACEIRQDGRSVRRIAAELSLAAYDRSAPGHFLPDARQTTRTMTLLHAQAARLRIVGPRADGVASAEEDTVARRGPLAAIIHVTAQPPVALDAQRAALDELIGSLTWF